MKKIIGIILIILICLASGFFFIKYKFNNENTFMEQTLNAFKDEERLKKQKYLQCMNEPFKDTVIHEKFADISNIYAKSGVAIYFKDLNNNYELKGNENKIKKLKEKYLDVIDIMKREERLKQNISDIAHDLRTPLSSIMGYITLLDNCTEKEKKEYINIIQRKSEE